MSDFLSLRLHSSAFITNLLLPPSIIINSSHLLRLCCLLQNSNINYRRRCRHILITCNILSLLRALTNFSLIGGVVAFFLHNLHHFLLICLTHKHSACAYSSFHFKNLNTKKYLLPVLLIRHAAQFGFLLILICIHQVYISTCKLLEFCA